MTSTNGMFIQYNQAWQFTDKTPALLLLPPSQDCVNFQKASALNSGLAMI